MANAAHHLLPGDEIDPKALKLCVARFKRHHETRLQASKQRMTRQQARVLDALPLLYHCNHPSLPGYINTTVPAGLPNYRPTAQARQAVGGLHEHSYRAQRTNLQAIFIMGSTGSVAQTHASDVDLWVCCEAHLHPALWPKVHAINHWARSHGMEMQTFLVDPKQFQHGQNIQGCDTPTLLLDEFYRSATFIAGRYPLWWLVPPDAEHRYQSLCHHLLEHRFVDPEAVIDFGPVAMFPDAELALAAVTELTRALSTPHKSLLKLKLVGAYAHAPEDPPVSARYKQAVYAGNENSDALDAYVLLLQHLENHLTNIAEHDQLPLIRHLFVRKITHRGSLNNPRLLELCQGWGFSQADIDHTRNPQHWRIRELLEENQRINGALQSGLQLVRMLHDRIARDTNESNRDVRANESRIKQLARAVDLLTNDRPGTIPRINPALIPANYGAKLAAERHGDGWCIRDGADVVYVCERLAEIAGWAHINHLCAPELPVDHPRHQNLRQIWLALVSDQASSQVFVNAETDIEPQVMQRRGLTLLTRHDDPLDFGGLHQLQLLSVDVLAHNTANQWVLNSCTDGPTVLQSIIGLMSQPPASVAWHAIGDRRVLRIQTRLENLHTQLHEGLREDGDRFIFPFGRDIVCVTLKNGEIASTSHASESDLRRALRSAGGRRITYDRASLRLSKK